MAGGTIRAHSSIGAGRARRKPCPRVTRGAGRCPVRPSVSIPSARTTAPRRREVDEADDEGLPRDVGVDAADQAGVDLDDVGPQVDEVAEVRDAGPGVIDGQADVGPEGCAWPRGAARSP